MVPQVQFIDEIPEVPEIIQKQGPMIQKVENAQKTGQIKPQRSSAELDAAQTQAALNEEELFTEVHKRGRCITQHRTRSHAER